MSEELVAMPGKAEKFEKGRCRKRVGPPRPCGETRATTRINPMKYVRDDPIAITIPLIADAPAYDDQPLGPTNLQWCERELARIHAKGDRQPRLVRVGSKRSSGCPGSP